MKMSNVILRSFSIVLYVVVKLLVIRVHLTIAENGCDKSKDGNCKFKNYPTPYHVDTLFILRHIISADNTNSIFECAEACRDTLASQTCAFDEKDKTCYLFKIDFDDTGIALQLDQGWKHIFHLSNGAMSYKEASFPCNQPYCQDTCLPGYVTKCFEGFSGANCDQYTGYYESCKEYKEIETFGRNPTQVHAPPEKQFLPVTFSRDGVAPYQANCYFDNSERRLQQISIGSHTKRDQLLPRPYDGRLPIAYDEDQVNAIKQGDMNNCQFDMELKVYHIYTYDVIFVGWDGRELTMDNVPGCVNCKKYSYGDFFQQSLYITDSSFIPLREIRIRYSEGWAFYEVSAHQFYCVEN